MKKICAALVATACLSLSTPVRASLVREASLNLACQGDVPLVIYSGMGATLDFTQTGQVVERAWLGDPSQVTLDTARPIVQGTSILYLRRIEGIAFSGLPSASSTVLTTVLTGSGGAKVCQFPISYRTGTPEYTSLRLVPSRPTPGGNRAVASTENISARPQPALANALSSSEGQPLLERNIATSPFLLQGHTVNIHNVAVGINANAVALGQDNPVVMRVRDFIDRVRNGESQQSAAQALGIEWSLIVELDRQGETHRWGPQT